MVQGTASSVGKSVLVAALCRILRQDGWNVAPFKAQNMSLNSYVTHDGGEIGRAQVVQAEAACVEPCVDMNPILLKPEADNRSQLVVRGKPMQVFDAQEYFALKRDLWPVVTSSLGRLLEEFEVVIIEGAGSPAEVNLRDKDLVNMRVARHCQAPVLLVGDIDRGGVFASLVGTLELLEPQEKELVRALVINKFRGDLSLLLSGLDWLEQRTGVPIAGVIPYFKDIHIAEEDSVALEQRRALKAKRGYQLDIAVIGLPHISNFDEFDPLSQEHCVRLRYVEPNDHLGEPDLIIIPGTKSTIADLRYLNESSFAGAISARAKSGTPVVGICGGFQMLGEKILDPHGVESRESGCPGLGLLPLTTTFHPSKSTHQVRGKVLLNRGILSGAAGLSVTGYEIHMGQTEVPEALAAFHVEERSRRQCRDLDGYLNPEGNVLGTYIHGLFHNETFRRSVLQELARRKNTVLPAANRVISKEEEYDKLAELVRGALNISLLYELTGLPKHKLPSSSFVKSESL